jgi:hypothetical protein
VIGGDCRGAGDGPLAEALSLSLHRAMLMGRWVGGGLDQAEACLYGAGHGGAMPLAATLIGIVQASLSGGLIVLMALAATNALRLR